MAGIFRNMEDYILPFTLVKQRCAVCTARTGLLLCGSCKVVKYCGAAHQSSHRLKHKEACTAIRESREALEREESALRSNHGDALSMPPDVFSNAVGHFWGIVGTRDYMRARFAAANALLRVDTATAVEKALGHLTDMLRLCRSDNLGVRDIIPNLLLRLGREQECYDFIKWWTMFEGNYDFEDVTLPYLDLRGADAFEPVDMFCSKFPNLNHVVALTLLKLRLRLDLQAFEEPGFGFGFDNNDPSELDRPVGKLVRAKLRTIDPLDVMATVGALEDQYCKLCRVVNDANPYFWEALIDEAEGPPSLPSSYIRGSTEEAEVVFYRCQRVWQESEDAIVMITSETSKFVSEYKGAAAVADTGGTRSGGLEEKALFVEKKRAGFVFPSNFKPPLPTSLPAELFPTTFMGFGQAARFVCHNDRKKALVYADGACANNGQPGARAGWGVICGMPDRGNGNRSGTVAGPLENKGPFGDDSVATSNRAELRAAIAALRVCDWRSEGFDTIVIATDSSYVVDGATSWAKGWLRNGWKTRTGGDAKNRDLWDPLLGEVQQWWDHGLQVELWKIPRELNAEADAAAKAAAIRGQTEVAFQDALTSPRVLTLVLEYESLFDNVFKSLVSQITSKVNMERATTEEAALNKLAQEPPPSVILIADGALTRRRKVWERVIDRLREGTTVVLAGCFSGMVNEGEFTRFFAKLGLPWQRGSYHRSTVSLRHGAVDGHLANCLPPSYSQKALFVKNIDRSTAWYTERETSNEAAVVFAKVGRGQIGYIGDVNGERESDSVVLAMCGLLD